MKHLSAVGILLLACGVCAEETSSAVATNETPSASVTNNAPETVSIGDEPEAFPVLFPIDVEPYQVEPVSDELSSLFDQLDTAGAGATELVREILIRSLSETQGRAGTAVLRKWLIQRAESLDWADADAVEQMIALTGCAASLEAFQDCDIPAEVWDWLFSSIGRVRLVAQTITEDDNPCEAARIIRELYAHDPSGRDRFLNLILALSVVWDTPRKALHHQIENGWLPPAEDITLYYDYFKQLYSSDKTKVPYDELSVDSLVFVVDTPTPIRELEWALENVDSSRAMWGRHYDEITYDYTRLIRQQYDWPHRDYTLQEIEECFGICVDQAYYCLITARAHGIPSLFFRGIGKFSGHAWFGFLRKPTEWDMDVGRYSDQGYAVGFAKHPQFDHEMTDHELDYYSERALRPVKARKAAALKYLAALLYQEDAPAVALPAARQARRVDPMSEAAWEIECDILADAERYEEAVELMDQKADRFKFF
ncbi:MAG TPA: hypothetical protein VJ904_08290, partial [Tichowtungia sp.]|nr:hypothetical protein [Tichowtungia sp.]